MRTDWVPLIRNSHLITSAVEEVLECDPLRAAGAGELTPRQFHLLEFIDGSRHHLDDVARFLGISPPAATKAVDRLERLGLIERSGSDDDRRLTILACSSEGRHFVDRVHALQQEALAQALHDFGDEDVARLNDLLERYALALLHGRDAS